MAMVVKNNMSAVSTLNTLNKNSSALQKSLQKVSSGMKINSAQDDASGYAISEKMRVQIRSLDQANQNTQNASSMMKTAEGAVSSTVEILKSLKEKAINAATDTNTDSDRVTIQKEIDQFIDQIDDNALTTFNGKYMVDGSKQQQGQATFTAMTNQSLDKETNGSTKLIDLNNRNGDSLEIASTDYVTASFVMNGKTYTTKFSVGSDTNLQDVFNNLNSEYQTQTHTTDAVFGSANTDTSTAAGMDSATAQSYVSNASADDLFKAASNATGSSATLTDADGNAVSYADIKTAVSTLYEADSATFYTNAGISSLADATSALTTTAAGFYTDLDNAITSTKVANNGGSGLTSDTVVAATFSSTATAADGTTSAASIATATNTVGALVGSGSNSSSTFVTDASTTSDTVAAAIVSSAKNAAAYALSQGAYAGGEVQTAITNATTVTGTITGTTAGNGNNVAASDLGLNSYTAPTTLTYAAADDYAKSYALAQMLPGGGSAEVLSSTDIGINTAGDMVKTADGEVGLTVTAAKSTIQHQVSGVTISITDSEGQVKKSANAALDDFNTTIYAKNKSDRNELTFQVGAAANQSITVGLDDMRAEALGLKSSDGTKVSVATQDNANAAVKVFDNAIQKALDQQTTIGAVEARLEYTSNNLTTSSENVQAAESTIRDADMAKEMTAYTKNNVLLQAAQSMLAQANQSSSQVLSLLQ